MAIVFDNQFLFTMLSFIIRLKLYIYYYYIYIIIYINDIYIYTCIYIVKIDKILKGCDHQTMNKIIYICIMYIIYMYVCMYVCMYVW